MGNESSKESAKGSKPAKGRKTLQPTPTMKFKTIRDQYTTIESVQGALRAAGLESSQLVVGIDFTKSNRWQGEKTFNGRCLHEVGETPNPYEVALVSIASTLAAFDDDNLIPAYGFGDVSTADKNVFSFFSTGRPCQGLQEALYRYRTIAPLLLDKLAGPTTFAPLIYEAMKVVAHTGQYHILLIVADGQVSEGVHTQRTVEAVVAASEFPLSIVMVGVGDGPWDQMQNFDDLLPQRKFDNFQFVELNSVITSWNQLQGDRERLQAAFALKALMEIPDQYKLIKQLGFLGKNYTQPMHPSLLVKTDFAQPPPSEVQQWDQYNGTA